MKDAGVITQDYIQFVERVRDIGKRHLYPPKGTAAAEDKGYIAVCDEAVAVLVAVANTFAALRTFKPVYVAHAFADLTMSLTSNSFWARHNVSIFPVYNVALNAMFDAYLLAAEREQNPQERLWDNMFYSTKNEWINIASAIAYCLGGYSKMRDVSLVMRKELEGVLS